MILLFWEILATRCADLPAQVLYVNIHIYIYLYIHMPGTPAEVLGRGTGCGFLGDPLWVYFHTGYRILDNMYLSLYIYINLKIYIYIYIVWEMVENW